MAVLRVGDACIPAVFVPPARVSVVAGVRAGRARLAVGGLHPAGFGALASVATTTVAVLPAHVDSHVWDTPVAAVNLRLARVVVGCAGVRAAVAVLGSVGDFVAFAAAHALVGATFGHQSSDVCEVLLFLCFL